MLHPFAFHPAIHDSVQKVLQDGTWCNYQGWATEELATKLSSRFQQVYVQLCSSGTIATELALRGLYVGLGDEVILSAYDFPGNFRAVEAVGATPVLLDTAINSWCIDFEELDRAASVKTKCLIVSHLHGHNTPMRRVMQWAETRSIHVIEDSCQAPGAIVDSGPAGSWGHCSTLSFGGSKLLTAGRGGTVLCKSDRVAQRIKSYCERGNDAFAMSQLQAAALLPQLDVLESLNLQRSRTVQSLLSHFVQRYDWLSLLPSDQVDSNAFYKFGFLVQESLRDLVIAQLTHQGLECGPGFHGFHRRGEGRCRKVGELNQSRRLAQQTVLLQHHHLLEHDLIDRLTVAFDLCDKVLHEDTAHQ